MTGVQTGLPKNYCYIARLLIKLQKFRLHENFTDLQED